MLYIIATVVVCAQHTVIEYYTRLFTTRVKGLKLEYLKQLIRVKQAKQ